MELMERGFKGIWIPAEVWRDDQLSWLEKMLLVEIDRLDTGEGCTMSDKYFAKFFREKDVDISNAIAILNYDGLIEVKYDNKTRYLRVLKEGEYN